MTQQQQQPEELLVVPSTLRLRIKRSLGLLESKFARGLKDGKTLGIKCPRCRCVKAPPVPVCPFCHVKMGEWVDQGNTGTLLNFSKVEMEQMDPTTGQRKPFPYPLGAVKLDGGVAFDCFIGVDDVSKLKLGMKVRAAWKDKDQREGKLTDILYFAPIGQEGGS